MKKTLLLSALFSALFLFPVLSPAQNLLIPLLRDSSHRYYYSDNENELTSFSRSVIRYNSSELEEVALYESTWAGLPTSYYRDTMEYDNNKRLIRETGLRSLDSPQGPWEKWSLDTFEYDDQGRLIHFTDYYGDGDNLVPYFAEYYWFDEAAYSDSSLYVIWDQSLSQWGNRYRKFTKRTADGKVVQHNKDIWDDVLNDWKLERHDFYTYLPDGRLFLHKSNSLSSNNVNTVQTDSSIYSADGLLDSTFLLTKNSSSPIQYIAVTDYTYDVNEHLESSTIVVSSNNGVSYNPSARQFFAPGDGIYSNDYSFESLELSVSGGYKLQWDDNNTFTYLGNNRVLYVHRYRQSDGGPVHLQILDSVWYHIPAALAAHLPGAAANVECHFANPLPPGGLIVCDAPDNGAMLTLRISDLNGRVTGVETVRPGEAWQPFPDLAEGVYFLTIWQNGAYLGARKLIRTH